MRGQVDGTARMLLEWLSVEGTAEKLTITGTRGDTQGPAVVVSYKGKEEKKEERLTFEIESVAGKPTPILDIDDDALVSDLRAAYGLPAPPLRALKDEDEPRFDRPLLSAFVPLWNGWLQLPLPNLPPIDTRIDANLATVPALASESLLDGFFRIRRPGVGAAVVSAYDDATADEQHGMPFDLTIEAARGLDLEVTIALSQKDGPKPTEFTVRLFGAQVSSRGLLVVSADRPDALEALPRLGAGPGLFIPVSLRGVIDDRNRAASMVAVRLDEIRLSVVSGAAGECSSNVEGGKVGFLVDSLNLRWIDLLERKGVIDALADARSVVGGSEFVPPKEDKLRPVLEALIALAGAEGDKADAALTASTSGTKYKDVKEELKALIRRRDAIPATDGELKWLRDELDSQVASHEQTESDCERAFKNANRELGRRIRASDEALVRARDAVGSALGNHPAPLPAVAWLRHDAMPLAATMAMTRAAKSSNRPLESRDLVPYRIEAKTTDSGTGFNWWQLAEGGRPEPNHNPRDLRLSAGSACDASL